MNIELHIERLVLDGLSVSPHDRTHLQATVEAELSRLLATGGLRTELLSGGAMRSLGAGEFLATNNMSALHLGHQIAHAVHSGVGLDTLGAEKFQTQTDLDRGLLAHELAHTLQTPTHSPVPSNLQITDASHLSERSADEAADAVMRGQSFRLPSVDQVSLARQTETAAQDNEPKVTLIQEKNQASVLVNGVSIYEILLPDEKGPISMNSELDPDTKTLKIMLRLPKTSKTHGTPATPQFADTKFAIMVVETRVADSAPNQLKKGNDEGRDTKQNTSTAVKSKEEHQTKPNPTFQGQSIPPGSKILEKYEISFNRSCNIYEDTSAAEAKLGSLAKLLKQYPNLEINVEGNVFSNDPNAIKGTSEAALKQIFYLNGKKSTAGKLMLARARRVRETLLKTFKVTNVVTISDGAVMDNSDGLKIFITIRNPGKS